jgi:hypothetical protein
MFVKSDGRLTSDMQKGDDASTLRVLSAQCGSQSRTTIVALIKAELEPLSAGINSSQRIRVGRSSKTAVPSPNSRIHFKFDDDMLVYPIAEFG